MENRQQNKLEVVKFGFSSLPAPIESLPASDDTYVTYGNDNLYPNYLLSLYGKSPIFANIINQKASFIEGGGLINVSDKKPLLDKPNTDDTWEAFTAKVIKSFLIFNAYAVEVNFNAFGQPIMWNYVPYEKIRMNKSKTKVWVCNDWSKKKEILNFERYVVGRQYDNNKSKIFIYDGYIPSAAGGVYTLPEYYSLIRHLNIDIEITEFNHSNIVNHFSVTTLINVYQNANEESKQAFQKSLSNSYKGSEGNKFIVSFNNQSTGAKPTEIVPLSSGDWTNAYESIKASNNETIFLGMQVVNPSLFGFKSAGSLGNTQELLNSYEILSKNVISTKRNELEAGLREMLGMNISFLDIPLFDTTLSEELKRVVMTIDEIRALGGLPPLANGAGTVLIGSASTIPALPVTDVPFKKEGFNASAEWEGFAASPETFEAVQHLGSPKSDFILYEGSFSQAKLQFDDESDIANYLVSTSLEGVTLAEIKKQVREKLGINISIEAVQKIIDDIVETGVIAVEKSGDTITIIQGDKLLEPVKKRVVETLYEYVKRPEATGATKLPTTRHFCQKIIDANKFYTLEDIQSISKVLNYDVFIHCGGFWRKKGTDETAPHCRHEWKQRQVVRKPNDKL